MNLYFLMSEVSSRKFILSISRGYAIYCFLKTGKGQNFQTIYSFSIFQLEIKTCHFERFKYCVVLHKDVSCFARDTRSLLRAR